jgi:hypothetical protein
MADAPKPADKPAASGGGISEYALPLGLVGVLLLNSIGGPGALGFGGTNVQQQPAYYPQQQASQGGFIDGYGNYVSY